MFVAFDHCVILCTANFVWGKWEFQFQGTVYLCLRFTLVKSLANLIRTNRRSRNVKTATKPHKIPVMLRPLGNFVFRSSFSNWLWNTSVSHSWRVIRLAGMLVIAVILTARSIRLYWRCGLLLSHISAAALRMWDVLLDVVWMLLLAFGAPENNDQWLPARAPATGNPTSQ